MSWSNGLEEFDRIKINTGRKHYPTGISHQNPIRIPTDFSEMNKGKGRIGDVKLKGRRLFPNKKEQKAHERRVEWMSYCWDAELPLTTPIPSSFMPSLKKHTKVTPKILLKRRKIA